MGLEDGGIIGGARGLFGDRMDWVLKSMCICG